MKIKSAFSFRATFASLTAADKIIVTFGRAQLVRRANGGYALLGGSASEHAEAREWCALFAPEVVFASLPSPVGFLTLAE
jgi:hypothetical protein